MKTYTKIFLALSAGAICSSIAFAQSYCIPPGFKSIGGAGAPFTFISNVTLENLDNSSGMPTGSGDDNGYKYFDNVTVPVLQQGTGHSLKVSSVDNLGQGMEVVVWIDWNGDKTFDASSERVAHWALDGDHGIDINVPKNAPDGIVRMRVYCDMPASMGHIPAEPCGYLNYPSHAIGQHGEVEDYDLRIGAATGINGHDNKSQLSVYPIPANNSLTIEYEHAKQNRYVVLDLMGREQLSGNLTNNTQNIDVTSLVTGHYILIIQGEEELYKKRFQIAR